MSYLLTSATDVKDLMGKIRDFAVTDGWTLGYDHITSAGQLGISKGACVLAMQATNTTHTDAVTAAVLNESYIDMALCESFAAGVYTYYGHTGSIVTFNGDNDAPRTTDLYGPFPNVWLFSDAAKTKVHVVAQASADRYSFISFGILDDKGLTQPDVAYVAGHDYMWWNNVNSSVANNSRGFNDPSSNNHRIGFFNNGNILCRIPNGLLDSTIGYTAGTFHVSSTNFTADSGIIRANHVRQWQESDAYANTEGLTLDYFMCCEDDVTTGGNVLSSMPVWYEDSDAPGIQYLGDHPDVRAVHIQNLAPAQELTYASDTYLVFPMKQKGTREDSNWGANYTARCNSIYYGFAFKKVV